MLLLWNISQLVIVSDIYTLSTLWPCCTGSGKLLYQRPV